MLAQVRRDWPGIDERMLRLEAVRRMIGVMVDDVLAETERRLAKHGIETVEDVDALVFSDGVPLAFLTQTTLSVDDTREIVAALQARFPRIVGPKAEDICYATSNRQAAVKAIAPGSDLVLVIGAPNSSNSQRLREVAEREGCKVSVLAQRAADLDWSMFEGIKSLGIKGFQLPTDGNGQLWVHYARQDPSLYVPVTNVLEKTVAPEMISRSCDPPPDWASATRSTPM